MDLTSFGFGRMASSGGKLDATANADRFMKLVTDNEFSDELTKAMQHVSDSLDPTPKGLACPFTAMDDIKKVMAEPTMSRMASGSLAGLQLNYSAMSSFDCGRIRWCLKEHSTVADFKAAVGSIKINFDTPSDSGKLVRLNKDAEVQAMCLLIYWDQTPELMNAAQDLIFEFVHGGIGSRSRSATLKLIDAADSKRKVTLTIK